MWGRVGYGLPTGTDTLPSAVLPLQAVRGLPKINDVIYSIFSNWPRDMLFLYHLIGSDLQASGSHELSR